MKIAKYGIFFYSGWSKRRQMKKIYKYNKSLD